MLLRSDVVGVAGVGRKKEEGAALAERLICPASRLLPALITITTWKKRSLEPRDRPFWFQGEGSDAKTWKVLPVAGEKNWKIPQGLCLYYWIL